MGSLRKMATLTGRQILLLRKIQKSVIANGATRSMASVKPWNYLWKPGPYPETEEERLAAAKKYGLIPEDYEPYPNDGQWNEAIGPHGLGDYPNLRRNFGEPMHYQFYWQQEVRGGYRYTKQFRSMWWHIGAFLVTMGLIGSPFFLLRDYPLHPPITKAQIPLPGEVYYTFEPAAK